MQQKHLNFFADFLLDLGGAVLYSIGIGLFAQNAGFAPGGISGLALLFYPLAHWMHEKEGKWWPWPKHKKKK